ncbi:MFS transporter [Streptomyces mangrovisoli]|uniref:MFS transporter n=1 Tax=Streptomyces mangrovisoli TaxID=1428628 RepID=A0A1J4NJZ3_9ACTN|nr:MFS transporter [Streptomyces mangrovisoli]OIJ62576.1 MFS transporter [Streptomyces mangrovisoli]
MRSAGAEAPLGRRFGWLWAAFAVSTFGTWLAFDAFPLIAIRVLHAGSTQVSLLSAAGLAVAALVAVPLGPWVEFRRKRPVMIAMDLVRCAALLTVPLAYWLGALSLGWLLAVSVLVAAADIAFTSASGACLKDLVPRSGLLSANARFESTSWSATILGPPLGGFALGVLGPVVTVAANAVSFLLSAVGIRAMGGTEARPERGGGAARFTAGDLAAGWRHILTHPVLRPLFFNAALNNGLIMAGSPLLAVLMLGRLGFSPWQYGLAFALPSLGGLVGSRLSRPLTARYGQRRVLLTAGTLRACWPVGLAFVGPGWSGLALVMGVEFGLITCCAVFNPVLATYKLEHTGTDRVARTLTAWSISTKTSIACLTALWGLLAGLVGTRPALAAAGLALLATPLLLPRGDRAQQAQARPVASEA